MITDASFPSVSVIIPTHNRCASLQRTLDALCLQTYPASLLEVLIVTDRCVDETAAMLSRYAAPFRLNVFILKDPAQGPASARNLGATAATGHLLLFIDDDVEPKPSLVMAHVQAHQEHFGRVVIGPYFPAVQGRVDYLRQQMRRWWEDKFHTIQQPGHRFSYCDVLSGNLSLEAAMFRHVGGFDPAFPCAHEDYELGIRLMNADATICFVPEALALHHEHESTNLGRTFQRARLEGRADVLIGHRHPDLRPSLPLAKLQQPSGVLKKVVHILAYRYGRLGDAVASLVQLILNPAEHLHFHSRWGRLYRGLRYYWYLRGVAEQIGTHGDLVAFVQEAPVRLFQDDLDLQIDLADGIESAEQQLDHDRPRSVGLRYGQQLIGRIHPGLGLERIRGRHLRPILATDLALPFVQALAVDGAICSEQSLLPDIRFTTSKNLATPHVNKNH